MFRRSSLVALVVLGCVGAACTNDELDEYPDAEEVPVTESQLDQPGPAQAGADTVLSPVTQPPPGGSPP